jgi:Ni,Fe-hydrogenase III small subunit/formate hydrogenlyase subunit 6/NADH:ubiquinone oxidoreductase subunit I
MLNALLERWRQGSRTTDWPDGPPPVLPTRFRGAPVLDVARCPDGCRACVEACPTDAIALGPEPRIDLGRCLFCTDCATACPEGTVTYGSEYSLAARAREHLLTDGRALEKAAALDVEARRLFGRSLKLRQVSAGGCGACEADTNVLGTVGWDLGRFGIQFVASPRHADGLLITGAVSANMELALRKTWEAVPPPKLVVVVGACAISGGPYLDHPEVRNGADGIVPVDLYVPGCPPHPLTILDGLLRLLGHIPR